MVGLYHSARLDLPSAQCFARVCLLDALCPMDFQHRRCAHQACFPHRLLPLCIRSGRLELVAPRRSRPGIRQNARHHEGVGCDLQPQFRRELLHPAQPLVLDIGKHQIQGAGLCAWRNDAEGHVNLAVDRCGEALHRAHSEFLQWSYEIGWLPLLLLIGLCWPLRKSMGRWTWFALPFLAFTFPAERAELMWPLAMLGWALKIQFPVSKMERFQSSEVAAHRVLLTSFISIALLLGSWVVAQNALGRIFQQSGNLKTNWSSSEQVCLFLHPQDIALNHADIFRAMSAFNAGQSERGNTLIQGHLKRNPRSIPAIRVALKLRGKPHNPDAVCAVLTDILAERKSALTETADPLPPLMAIQ